MSNTAQDICIKRAEATRMVRYRNATIAENINLIGKTIVYANAFSRAIPFLCSACVSRRAIGGGMLISARTRVCSRSSIYVFGYLALLPLPCPPRHSWETPIITKTSHSQIARVYLNRIRL